MSNHVLDTFTESEISIQFDHLPTTRKYFTTEPTKLSYVAIDRHRCP